MAAALRDLIRNYLAALGAVVNSLGLYLGSGEVGVRVVLSLRLNGAIYGVYWKLLVPVVENLPVDALFL